MELADSLPTGLLRYNSRKEESRAAFPADVIIHEKQGKRQIWKRGPREMAQDNMYILYLWARVIHSCLMLPCMTSAVQARV